MPRFSELSKETLTDAQRQVWDTIIAGKRGAVTGPFHMWLRSPTLAQRAQSLGEFLRYDTTLSPRLSELAILVTARFWTAQYEWHVHAKHAATAGLSAEVIAAIAERRDPASLLQPDEQAVYAFSVTLHERHSVDDATYAIAQKQLGEQGVVELVGLLGYYTMISMTLNTFHVPVPGGAQPLK